VTKRKTNIIEFIQAVQRKEEMTKGTAKKGENGKKWAGTKKT
jgi:hypothetical protein